MSNSSLEKQKAGFSITFLFFFVLCAYPFLSLFWRRSYPILTSEVFVILLVLAGLSLFFTATLSRIKLSVTALVTALLVTAVFLIQFNLSIAWMFTVFAVCVLLVRVFKSNFFLFGLTVITVMLSAALVENLREPNDFEPTAVETSGELAKPPIIHIILDGFIGVGGLPPYPASQVFEETVEQFFEKYGFELFPNAYSRFPYTIHSLYSAMNFTDVDINEVTLEVLKRRKHKLTSNAYFDLLEKSGYRFNIYQTDHIDFCRSNPEAVDRCWNYTQPKILTVRQISDLPRRVSMLGKILISQSTVLVTAFHKVLIDPGVAVYDSRVTELLKQDLFDKPDGKVFLAHLLIPHSPYVFLHDCSIKYEENPSLSYPSLENEPNPDPNVVEYRALRYFEQAECALVTLAALFDEMKLRSLFDQAYVVVHGDHGSHISKNFISPDNFRIFTSEDYRANYSTLFAYKVPFGQFAKDSQALPLSTLMEEFSSRIAIGNRAGSTAWTNQESARGKAVDSYIYYPSAFGMRKVDINLFEQSVEK